MKDEMTDEMMLQITEEITGDELTTETEEIVMGEEILVMIDEIVEEITMDDEITADEEMQETTLLQYVIMKPVTQ
jgi:hypothetical protein